MNNIGDRIKQRRKELKLSADVVAEKLGVSRSTVFRYEKGDIEKVPTTILEKLAEVLKTTPAYLIGWESENNSAYTKMLHESFDSLNSYRKRKVIDFSKLQLSEQNREKSKIYSIDENYTYYVDVLGSVSAGTGEWLDDEQHEEITVNNEPPMHDFALRVNGDSMIPLFSDGQIIYVNKIDDLDMVRNEQIVIAELNGDAYVKKIIFDNNRQSCQLISLNKDYQPINVTENDEFKVVGLVVL
ncbi:helix-turn-helix domain-containing protein [Ligilactobacillus salivarius]|uniref:Repressor n=1 Tax=Ligilactobacillus salivarius TaxID=1624 RepID=A0A1D7TST8_9LACO|nr:XRE family transcriptional regulator [Ligilactobacillus salivarius]AOO74023.1 repressor [Ligilactobacillus salivarius]UDE97912.1 XRE family transcriptional regulator [Ligilactobacillus salivarius]UUV97029.1 XRE family transcriptional regulator [Ligilactobacillus salivarius]